MIEKVQGKTLVGYGLGSYYNMMKREIPFKLQYLCDRRYEEFGEEYDGLPVISPKQLCDLENVLVIVFAYATYTYRSISGDLRKLGIAHEPIQKYTGKNITVTGDELVKKYPDGYCDKWGNEIIFDKSFFCEEFKVWFRGGNNKIRINKNVKTKSLKIYCGNNANCEIGEGTEIVEARIQVTNGKVRIGKDCLFSIRVWIANHDHHHIFDAKTGKRINNPKDIEIGNHVWVGEGVSLLSGFSIGDNSIIGAMSISSSVFGSKVIIAGNPAKVIRKDILWSGDCTEEFQWSEYEQCYDRRAEYYE